MTNPVYSLCICNYNMADTLEESLTSILGQLDESFETVIVDDGSTDQSVALITKMQEKYPSLRLVALQRDRNRKLGLTRNESIKAAMGEYVLLHLDCDDIYAPHLMDFTQVFHMIESAAGRDLLVSGQHINMARRDFLLKHGPYRNIFRGEDRDMWLRFAAIEAYMPLVHTDFVTRIPKSMKTSLHRAMMYTYDHILNDMRASPSLRYFFRYELKKFPDMNLQQRIFRIICYIPTYVESIFSEPLPPPANMNRPETFMDYRNKMRGTLSEILARYGQKPDWDMLSPAGRKIFE